MLLTLVGSVFSLTLRRTMCSIVWGGVDDDDILIWDRDAEEEGLKDGKKGLSWCLGTGKWR